MPETKKLLVAFDTEKAGPHSGDFLIPWKRDGIPVFLGLKSGEEFALGMLVYVGRSVSQNDLFARLVESGAFIASVEEIIANLRNYVNLLQTLKIGNVVRIISGDENEFAFGLELVAITPSTLLTGRASLLDGDLDPHS